MSPVPKLDSKEDTSSGVMRRGGGRGSRGGRRGLNSVRRRGSRTTSQTRALPVDAFKPRNSNESTKNEVSDDNCENFTDRGHFQNFRPVYCPPADTNTGMSQVPTFFAQNMKMELEHGLCLINDAFSKLREAEQRFLSLKAYMDFTGFGCGFPVADISNTSTGMSPVSPSKTSTHELENMNDSKISDVFVNEIPINPFSVMNPVVGQTETNHVYTPTLNSFDDIRKQMNITSNAFAMKNQIQQSLFQMNTAHRGRHRKRARGGQNSKKLPVDGGALTASNASADDYGENVEDDQKSTKSLASTSTRKLSSDLAIAEKQVTIRLQNLGPYIEKWKNSGRIPADEMEKILGVIEKQNEAKKAQDTNHNSPTSPDDSNESNSDCNKETEEDVATVTVTPASSDVVVQGEESNSNSNAIDEGDDDNKDILFKCVQSCNITADDLNIQEEPLIIQSNPTSVGKEEDENSTPIVLVDTHISNDFTGPPCSINLRDDDPFGLMVNSVQSVESGNNNNNNSQLVLSMDDDNNVNMPMEMGVTVTAEIMEDIDDIFNHLNSNSSSERMEVETTVGGIDPS